VAETDIGPEDPAATIAAPQPHGPVSQEDGPASQQAERAQTKRPGSSRGRGRWAGWLVIAIPAVTAFLVGGYQIGGPSLWRDEAYTKDAIGRSVSQIFALLGHTDAVHGAYYLLMHVVAGGIGTSATALRFPSLCAMTVTAAVTAAIGRRAATLAQDPGETVGSPAFIPGLTGLLAGLVFATAPFMTYYAQMARPYAIVTMFAAIASYLLLRAYPDGRWRWWSAYGAAVALTGLFNLFGLLILAAHGVTLLLTDARGQPGAGRRLGRVPLRWLAASAAAVIVLVPLARVASQEQQQQIGWLTRPDAETIVTLFRDFAGSGNLIIPVALLALGGVAVGCVADSWRPLNPAAIALPWLTVPSFLLLAASFAKPVYDSRYVEFCLPALAILVAAGLVGLVRLAARTRLARWPGPSWASGSSGSPGLGLAWLPAALVSLGLAALLIAPQHAIRQTSARPDNLRLASAIVAAHEQPGDVVFYLPMNMRVLGTGYPAPFLRLRDIARAESPIASATLTGTEVSSPAVLKSRFTDVRRVWVVTGNSNGTFPVPYTPVDKEKMALLAGMHIIGRWMAGEVMLTLYGY
jgi:mannosyltransferase